MKISCPEIHQMCIDHFNEPVLIGFDLGRLIGYAEDAEDCYLIIKYTRPRHGSDKNIVWHTAVGGYMFLDKLKGQNHVVPTNPSFEGEVWDDLIRLDYLLEVNGATKETEFKIDIRPDEGCFIR